MGFWVVQGYPEASQHHYSWFRKSYIDRNFMWFWIELDLVIILSSIIYLAKHWLIYFFVNVMNKQRRILFNKRKKLGAKITINLLLILTSNAIIFIKPLIKVIKNTKQYIWFIFFVALFKTANYNQSILTILFLVIADYNGIYFIHWSDWLNCVESCMMALRMLF